MVERGIFVLHPFTHVIKLTIEMKKNLGVWEM